ncbi:prolipoprotein diacylglyceryl transferase [Tenuibacillus multivorans]|uniref:Phosphatidylglycerol--prolipoprotein diacylglyceryl transferase n=1 Tax=Tenuibacillus multivorans TaxID=237069 RepID=A0A1H0DJI6_9BACI|nr:prolipoprotein diacylglyceryl transferase [Tenuibacillus multivorans]GEL76530.1 prolipoprotein diacylglyceryl transferase [Tenuibacillus multivorans]SDN70171.1 phosphatidylglycerol:prolipoprotein diacylglycerol transferase [Tenuibacillus multivorans]
MYCTAEPYDRVFFNLGPLPVYWYGVLIMLGALIGLIVAQREGKRLGLHKDFFIDLLVFAIPAAIVGARLYYVIFQWENYDSLLEIIDIREGGLAIHGALIGSVLTAWIYTRYKKVSFWKIADIAAPSLLIGQMLGRWGNFMNQEAYGGPVSEAAYQNVLQYLPDWIMNQMCVDGVFHHPTFLYESVWNFLGLILLLFLRYKVNPRRGVIFLSYLMWYSFGRFFIEGMRTDSLYIVPGLRTAQVISILLIIGSLIVLYYRKQKGYADELYDGTSLKKKSSKKKKKKK